MTDLVLSEDAQDEYFDQQYEVIKLHVQAESPTSISKKLKMKRMEVVKIIDHWSNSDAVQEEMHDRILELIRTLDAHYTLLIKKYWEIVNECDTYTNPSHQVLGQKNSALKEIANLEDKRIAVLQRSGMLNDEALGAEIAELEDQRDGILAILRDDLCDKCKIIAKRKIGQLMKKPEPLAEFAKDNSAEDA